MYRHPESFRVGDVLIAGVVQLSPSEVAGFLRSRLVDELVEDAQFGAASFGAQPRPGSVCPTPLVASQAVAALRHSGNFGGLRVAVHGIGPVTVFASPLVGEPLTCVATVRFRGKTRTDATPLTLSVELRRRHGGTVVRFEVGVELSIPAAPKTSRDALYAVA